MKPPIARLLIVDDEHAQVEALCRTLKSEGYLTSGAHSGPEALAILRAASLDHPAGFDILITDLMMPGMDGIALLRAARDIDSELVGIVMTGHATVDTAVEAMKIGALDYILKPFNLSTILPVLARALTMRRLRFENAALQQRLTQHSVALEAANLELQSANRELKHRNEELDAFGYSVSHDLRAPLRTIDGFSQILIEDYGESLEETSLDYIRRIKTAAQGMAALIEDMLLLSRVSRADVNREPVDLSTLARTVADELHRRDPERMVEMQIQPGLHADADIGLMRVLLDNLLGNAWKFTVRTVSARIVFGAESRGPDLVFSIEDNGAGFDMSYADKLFQPFQRLHQATDYPGTGIGLATVRRIVEHHGGRVWAKGAVDSGATVCFTIPMRGL